MSQTFSTVFNTLLNATLLVSILYIILSKLTVCMRRLILFMEEIHPPKGTLWKYVLLIRKILSNKSCNKWIYLM